MSRKKIILLVFLLLLAFVGWYAYKEYNRTNKDLSKTRADINITATELIAEFAAADSLAGKKYNGLVLDVKGNVKDVETDAGGLYTIILGNKDNPASVRCSMDSLYKHDAAQIKRDSSIEIRGVCTGFISDDLGLGSDVILNRAVVIKK